MKAIPVNPFSEYAPIRYEATRPFAVPLSREFLPQRARGEKSRLAFLKRFSDERRMEVLLQRIDRRARGETISAEITAFQVFSVFLAGGRVIFDLDPVLVSNLCVTDIDDVPCGALSFPAESFYLHFGVKNAVEDGSTRVEGVFVEQHDGGKVSFHLAEVDYGSMGFTRANPTQALWGPVIDFSDKDASIEQALQTSLTVMQESYANSRVQFEEELERMRRMYPGHEISLPETIAELAPQRQEIMRKALRAAINAIFYLTSQDDSQEDWSRDVDPDDLQELAREDLKPGTRKTLENTLRNEGYRKVLFVGRRFAQSAQAIEVAKALGGHTGRTLATHFRRGHYRPQAYGEKRLLRKWIFVAPTVVNAHLAQDMPGKIYEVRPEH